MAEQALLGLLRPHDTGRHDHPQRRDVPAVRVGVECPKDRLGERVADDRRRVDAVALHGVEELLGAEVTALHRGDRAPDHQVAEGVEQPRAVHQRCGGHVARARLHDALGHGIEILFGGHPLLVVGVEHPEQVVLTPHHALGHAGRTAGVEQQEVIAAASPGALDVVVGSRRCHLLVGSRPRRAWAAAIVDPQPGPHLRHPFADGVALLGERAVEHDCGGVGVVPQVHEFVGCVAVVGVDHGEAGLERCEHRLEVLRAVVEVLGHLVLLGRFRVQQRGGDTVGPPVELGPRVGALALLLGERVGDLHRHRLPQVCEVPATIGRRHVDERSGSVVRRVAPGGGGRRRRRRGSVRPSRPTSTRSTTWLRRLHRRPGSAR